MAPKAASKSNAKRRRQTRGPMFINDNAEAHYNGQFIDKDGIKERGMFTAYEGIKNIIEHRKWSKFAEQPTEPVIQIVREFYANAKAQLEVTPSERQIEVRGKKVSFDSGSINAMLQLEDFESDEYSEWVEQGPDYDQVIRRLARPGSKWTTDNSTVINFPRGQLKFISRGWHYFICARLLPTDHPSHVKRERAELNYAIQQGMSINVGRVIENSIISLVFGKKTGKLGHPSLIFELCLLAEVPVYDNEERQPLLPPIDDAVMEQFERTSRPGSQYGSTSDAAEPSSSRGKSAPSSSKAVTMKDQLHDIQAKQDRLMKQQNRMEQDMGQTLSHHTEQMEYVIEWTKAMSLMFQSGNFPSGCSAPVFPTPPAPLQEASNSDGGASDSDE